MGGNLKNILPEKRFPAGHYDHRLAEGGNFIEKSHTLVGSELSGIGTVPGRGPTVDTGKITASGYLPGHHPQGIWQNRKISRSLRRPVIHASEILSFDSSS